MAEIEVLGVDIKEGRVSSLKVRFKGMTPRKIDRDTALQWLAAGHALVPFAEDHGHVSRSGGLMRVEVDGELFLRGDTDPTAADSVVIGAAGH